MAVLCSAALGYYRAVSTISKKCGPKGEDLQRETVLINQHLCYHILLLYCGFTVFGACKLNTLVVGADLPIHP